MKKIQKQKFSEDTEPTLTRLPSGLMKNNFMDDIAIKN